MRVNNQMTTLYPVRTGQREYRVGVSMTVPLSYPPPRAGAFFVGGTSIAVLLSYSP